MTCSGPAPLDDDAWALLLSVLELPLPVLSGAVALDHNPREFAALRELNLLVPHGSEQSALSRVHGGEKVGHWSGGVMLLRAE